jgi:hypothetical protein
VKARVPRLAELIDARVTNFCPFQVGDYGFIATDNGVMIGKGTHKLISLFPLVFLQVSHSCCFLIEIWRQKWQTLRYY